PRGTEPSSYTSMGPIIASVAASVIIASGGTDPPHIILPLRVTVIATAAVDRAFIDGMVGEAAAIWRAAGVTISWRQSPGDRPDLPGTKISVTLHDDHSESPDG